MATATQALLDTLRQDAMCGDLPTVEVEGWHSDPITGRLVLEVSVSHTTVHLAPSSETGRIHYYDDHGDEISIDELLRLVNPMCMRDVIRLDRRVDSALHRLYNSFIADAEQGVSRYCNRLVGRLRQAS